MNFEARIQRLQKKIPALGIDSLLVEEPVDIFYLTGIDLSLGSLLISSDQAQLIVDGRYHEACSRVPFLTVHLFSESIFGEVASSLPKIGFCEEKIVYSRFQRLQEMVPDVQFTPVADPVLTMRGIKEPEELDLLRETAALGSRGFDYVCTRLQEGVTERDLVRDLHIFWLQEGGDDLAFSPIIAFGEGTSIPHYHPTDRELRKGDAVLIDIGVKIGHYHSDMTRVVFFREVNPKMEEIYGIVREAQRLATGTCRAGARAGEVDEAARGYITKMGYGDNFTHGLGHGVGLEIHELPVLSGKEKNKDVPLEKGMVVTIEPGIYLSGIGGVRLEDTVIVTDGPAEDITKRSKEIRII